uniref:ABC transporter substrate-binding protein n=1 Tax=Anaerovibrio sp. TaxID=1872532 RepID=UPI0025F1F34B
TGSIQHILLGMAAEKNLGDAHALDNNIQRMSHAEGMAALEAGVVKLHLTSAPFIYQEREQSKYVELPEVNSVWPQGNTFLVAMASTSLEKDKELYEAVRKAFLQSVDFINANPDKTVAIEEKYLQLDEQVIKSYMNKPDCKFFNDIRGLATMASFMKRAGFIDNDVTREKFCYDGVACE